MSDLTALSYWFPKLLAAGLPVPRTTIVKMPEPAQRSIWAAFDGEDAPDSDPKPFFAEIARAAAEFGYPCFLRTDYTSDKHSWLNTCFLPDEASIPQHVFNIAEFSECASMIGLPWDTWAVREMLPTRRMGTCPRYGNMPICREFRFFLEDDRVVCRHFYWPHDSLIEGGADPDFDYEAMCGFQDGEEAELTALASAAGKAVGGAWSVDILEMKRGWFVTDMAEASKSFHWEGCPHA